MLAEGGQSTMGIRNLSLQRSKVRNRGKIRLNAGFYFFLSLHHLRDGLENISIFCLPLFISVVKKLFAGKINCGAGGSCIPHVTPMDSEVSSETAVTAGERGVIKQMS
jgi:hypothetical protein